MNSISKYIIGAFTILLVVLAFYYLGDILGYIIVAWVLSMIGTPMVNFLRKFVGKGVAAGITIFSFLIGIIFVVWLIFPPVLRQINHLSEIDYVHVMENLQEPIDDWNNWLSSKGLDFLLAEDTPESIIESSPTMHDDKQLVFDTLYQSGDIDSSKQLVTVVLQVKSESNISDTPVLTSQEKGSELLHKLRDYLLKFINPNNIPSIFGSVFGLAGNVLVYLLAVLFIGFFFMKEQGLFARMIGMWVPKRNSGKIDMAITEVSELLVRYFVGIAIQVTIITIFVSVLLTIFGVKNGLMIGFLVGLINVIPYIGPLIGWAFGIVIIVSFSLNLSFYDEILPLIGILTAVIGTMQLLDNVVLQPNIFSRSIKAHPLEIFLVILIAAKVGGVLGMVLAIPIYTVFRVITRVFLSKFEILNNLAIGLNDQEE